MRLGSPPRLRPYVLATLVVALVLAGALTAAGPLQRGWAARVGTVPGPSFAVTFPTTPFRDTLSGLAQPYTRYILDPGFQMLTLDLAGTGTYPVNVAYRMLVHVSQYGIRLLRGLFTLAPVSDAWNCSGSVTFRPPDRLEGACRPSATETLRVDAEVRLDRMGRVQGSIVVIPHRVAKKRR